LSCSKPKRHSGQFLTSTTTDLPANRAVLTKAGFLVTDLEESLQRGPLTSTSEDIITVAYRA